MAIGRKAVRGVAWTISTSIGARAVGLVGTLLLVRYLLPADYGEVSAASVIVLTADQFSTVGVGMYLIVNPKSGREIAFHATAFHLTTGLLALSAVLLLRGSLGPLVDAPTLARYVPGLVLAVLLDRLVFIPERLVVREMRFGLLGLMRTSGELSYTFVSVGTAMMGWGGMAIVAGNIARAAVRLTFMLVAVDRRDWLTPCRIKLATIWMLVRYGIAVSLGAFATFASRRWDNLLVSRYFGPAILGAYNLAYNLADIPAVQVGEQITDVLLTAFSQLEHGKRSAVLVRACNTLALVMFPLAAGLGAVAPTITAAFFPQKWIEVGPMLLFLSALSAPRPIGAAIAAYLQSRNNPRAVMWIEMFNLALVCGGIASYGRIGYDWACIAVGVAFTARALVYMWAVKRTDRIPIGAFLNGMWRPLLACVPLVCGVLAVRHAFAQTGWHSMTLRLGAEVVTGGLMYLAGAWVIAPRASRELIDVLRDALSRRKEK
ncbi:MAG TPA: oligosaccharide flippase family protein [Polyangia bacterium]